MDVELDRIDFDFRLTIGEVMSNVDVGVRNHLDSK